MGAYIYVKMSYPSDKADEVGKVFLKIAGSLPKVLKRVSECPWSYPDENGYAAINIFEVEEARYFEALKELARFYANYRHVTGYRYKIEPVLAAKDALPLLGLQPPATK